jgi:signal transduction histidine kinase/DNA-binding response OmpR family regulator
MEDGLSSNMIYSIEEDDSGLLWIGTGYGLSQFDPETELFHNFYIYDGLQENQFQAGASYKDSDGKLFFGGINGLSAFYPARVAEGEQSLGNIRFSKLTVLGRTVEYTGETGRHPILDRPIDQARQIVLKKNQNLFSLEFSVLEYTNPKKVRYGYRMEGFDTDWHYADASQHSATYTNLPHGRYGLQIKAFYDGDADESQAVYNRIDIRILPAWYETGWAWAVYCALAVAVVLLFVRFLNRRRMRARERMEMERKEMKLRMFTDMSHEIRTPLTLVMTPLKTIWENEKDDKRKNLYNLMYRNARRILTIINQLVDMNRIDSHQFQMRFRDTDMIFFLRDIVRAFEHQAVTRNIDCRIVSNLESLEVWIDQAHFDKVVFNIISNAFKFTPDNGSVLISLETYLNNRQNGVSADASRYLEMRFENSGSHVPPNELERIFERFYQLDGSRSGGSGIGLHLAKRIAELHYGTLWAENTDNGVVFILRIPLGDAHLSVEQKAEKRGQRDLYGGTVPEIENSDVANEEVAERSSEQTDKPTIYFVDDDPDMLKYVHLELADTYRIETFPGGEEAWAGIMARIPDAVVTDLVMPQTDGAALCRKIRASHKTDHLPIIVLTAETTEESECRCLEVGADRFLTKPISLELLKGTIAQSIRIRETLRNKYRIATPQVVEDDMEVSSPNSRLVARVIECIRQNIEDPDFNVDELSRQVGISRVHLNRKLKENINISPSNLIRSIRLRRAAYLLVRHEVYVSEAAYRVGFSSPSSFSNTFRDYFGMSPTEYVAKHADNDAMSKEFDIAQ